MLMKIILVKLTLYLAEKKKPKKENFTVSFPGETPLKLKKKNKKKPKLNQTISIPYLLQALCN